MGQLTQPTVSKHRRK